jgi:hypothetical protein
MPCEIWKWAASSAVEFAPGKRQFPHHTTRRGATLYSDGRTLLVACGRGARLLRGSRRPRTQDGVLRLRRVKLAAVHSAVVAVGEDDTNHAQPDAESNNI